MCVLPLLKELMYSESAYSFIFHAMKKFALLSLSALLLTACGGPAVADYGTGTLTYNSSVWDYNAEQMLLLSKEDTTCWVDLTGEFDDVFMDELVTLEEAGAGEVTSYIGGDGSVRFASFDGADRTFYGLMGGMDIDPNVCLGYVVDLATSN